MLLVNKKQIATKDVGKELGIYIPLDKLLKKPLFEINPALILNDSRANGPGATRVRQGMEFPAEFRVRLKNGEDVEIRYCRNRTPNVKTHGQTEIYTPKKLPFEGKAEFLNDDADKAIYYYLHFFNRQSPFRDEGYPFHNKPWDYEFQDDLEKANLLIAGITLRRKAEAHADSLQGEEMIIIAKGMRIEGIHGLDPVMIKAKLMQYAHDFPKEYLEKSGSTVNHMEGLIRDAMDSNILVMQSTSNSKRWVWDKGPKEGQVIVELSNTIPDFRQALITHIQQTPNAVNEFLPTLINTRTLIAAKSSINSQLQGVDVLGMLKQAKQHQVDDIKEKVFSDMVAGGIGITRTDTEGVHYVDPMSEEGSDILNKSEEQDDQHSGDYTGPIITALPATFKDAQAFLGEHIGKKTPALAKKFLEDITNGEIRLDNIHEALEGLKMEVAS